MLRRRRRLVGPSPYAHVSAHFRAVARHALPFSLRVPRARELSGVRCARARPL